MRVHGQPYRTIFVADDGVRVAVIDQTRLPFEFELRHLQTAADAARAIRDMIVRGAPLIGVTAAYGVALAMRENSSDVGLDSALEQLEETRPTAVNLRWALDRVRAAVAALPPGERADAAWREADAIVVEDVAINHALGQHGLALLRQLARKRAGPLRVMTHCNAGALATCGWGTATAPIFLAHLEGLPLQVWVSETRPRLQGANLTAWEMAERGIPYTLHADVASAALMSLGEVDLVIVGADRVARNGDVCNKIGTYGKALAARDNDVPFYVAVPSPTIDWAAAAGAAIPIESRDADEVLQIVGRDEYGQTQKVAIAPHGARAANPAFDVTPARLVTGIITERGIASATVEGLLSMYPERAGTTA